MSEIDLQRCSSAFTGVIIEGAQEIIGPAGIQAVFNLAQRDSLVPYQSIEEMRMGIKYDDLSAMVFVLEDLYGPRSAHGVLLRAGRASFRYLMRDFGDVIGIGSIDYRLQPARQRLRGGLEALAGVFREQACQLVEIGEDSQHWIWRSELKMASVERELVKGISYFITGILQEYMEWVSGGKYYPVNEQSFVENQGKVIFTLQIDKHPLG